MTAAAIALVLALQAAEPPPVAPAPAPRSAPVSAPVAGTAAPAPQAGEPLPAGAPKGEYELTAWCYGAMSEYLDVYDKVKPDLRAIDKAFGSSAPNEKEPYAGDMAAARQELEVLASAVTAAEKASPSPIAPQGVEAVRQGRSIWSPAEQKTRRELARAWLSWAMPDKCDSTARELAAKSALLGQALEYNAQASTPAVAPGAPTASDTTPAPTPDAPTPDATAPPAPTAAPDAPPPAYAPPSATPDPLTNSPPPTPNRDRASRR